MQSLLTETEEGSRWLEAAHHTAMRIFSDQLANQNGAEEAVGGVPATNEDNDDDDDTLLI